MLQEQQIQQVVKKLVSVAKPQQLILFGSYARGEATEDSDLDLLVVKSRVSKKGLERVAYRNAIGSIGVGVDILVYPASHIKERANWCSSPIYWALREGKVLYDAERGSKSSAQSCRARSKGI